VGDDVANAIASLPMQAITIAVAVLAAWPRDPLRLPAGIH